LRKPKILGAALPPLLAIKPHPPPRAFLAFSTFVADQCPDLCGNVVHEFGRGFAKELRMACLPV
jgi:hypothetical protein